MTKNPTSLTRRHWLAGGASTLAAAGLTTFTRPALAQAAASSTANTAATSVAQAKSLPAYVSWKDPASVIVHDFASVPRTPIYVGLGPRSSSTGVW